MLEDRIPTQSIAGHLNSAIVQAQIESCIYESVTSAKNLELRTGISNSGAFQVHFRCRALSAAETTSPHK